MAIQNDTTLKSYFETNDTPTEAQFGDLIDSKASKTGASTIAIDNIDPETPGGAVKVDEVQIKGNKIAQGTVQTTGYLIRQYDINAWNMNVSSGGDATKTVVVDGGMKYPDAVIVGIFPDTETTRVRSFERFNGTTTGGDWKVNANGDVELQVNSSGPFDSNSYSNTGINRGKVTCIKFSNL